MKMQKKVLIYHVVLNGRRNVFFTISKVTG